LRRPAAAGAICLALTAPSLLIGAAATARPMHIRAVHRSGWSFIYRGRDGPTREPSLYLPKDRPVVVRIVRRPEHAHATASLPVTGRRARTIKVDPLHRGDLSLTYGHSTLPADVLGPKAFHEQLEAAWGPGG